MSNLQRIVDFDDPQFNPFIADEIAFGCMEDLYSQLAHVRSEGPVHAREYRSLFSPYPDITLAPFKHLTVLSHHEVEKVLNDASTFSNEVFNYNLGQSFGRSITTMKCRPVVRQPGEASWI